MSDRLKAVLEQARQRQQQTSQASKPAPVQERKVQPQPVPAPVVSARPTKQEIAEDDDLDYLREDEPEPQPVQEQPQETTEQPQQSVDDEIKAVTEQISALHDNGVYRLEVLNQLQQINQNLAVMASVLLEFKKK